MTRNRRNSVKNKNSIKAIKPLKKSTGATNRRKGHNEERKVAQEFRELGFPYTKTSRQASKLLDDCKVDIYGIPYNVQVKNVQASIKYQEIFDSMSELLEKNMPERLQYPQVIFHKKSGEGNYVIMTRSTFYNLLRQIHEQK